MKAQMWLDYYKIHRRDQCYLRSAPRHARAGRAGPDLPTESHDHMPYMPLLAIASASVSLVPRLTLHLRKVWERDSS